MGVFGVVLVSFALAGYPGTHQEPRLEAAASFAAGKQVSVYCGDSPEAWSALVVSLGGPPTANGFSDKVGGIEEYLAPSVCEPLLAWPSSDTDLLGESVLTLAHEATHLRGVTDESLTDCAALALVPIVASRWYVSREVFENMTPFVIRDVTEFAWAGHRRKPPAYQGAC